MNSASWQDCLQLPWFTAACFCSRLPARIRFMGRQWTQAKLELHCTWRTLATLSPSQMWTRPAVAASGGRPVTRAQAATPGTDPESYSGSHLFVSIHIHRYCYLFITYSKLFCTCSRVPNSRTSTVNKPWNNMESAWITLNFAFSETFDTTNNTCIS